jgi:hypothetical protein
LFIDAASVDRSTLLIAQALRTDFIFRGRLATGEATQAGRVAQATAVGNRWFKRPVGLCEPLALIGERRARRCTRWLPPEEPHIAVRPLWNKRGLTIREREVRAKRGDWDRASHTSRWSMPVCGKPECAGAKRGTPAFSVAPAVIER